MSLLELPDPDILKNDNADDDTNSNSKLPNRPTYGVI